MWPQTTPGDNMAPPDYAVFESNLMGESDWTEVGRANVSQTSMVAKIPGNSENTNYRLRVKSVSNSTGTGAYYTATDVFIIYSEGMGACLTSASICKDSTNMSISPVRQHVAIDSGNNRYLDLSIHK